ncbi:MAG: LysR family transcriptional regulator [Alphaproteobacteria bacterium]|nr:LysR family transcriptional regulator [Alphaproteobacteria bacterium]
MATTSALDWNKLKIFHAAADAGSFTRAGEHLNLSQSAISRQISALEEELGVPLFHRHARGLKLTEQGETLYRTAHEVSAKLAMAEAVLGETKEKPSGELKITTTVGFGSTWLTSRIGEFLALYPDLTVDLVLEDRLLDLSMREADIAIRMRESTQHDLIQRKLLTVHNHPYASPDYLRRLGSPRDLKDLATKPRAARAQTRKPNRADG